VTDPEEFLSSLTGPLAAIQETASRLRGPDVVVDPRSGALCVSARPRIGSEAYALRLFPAADETMIASYEEIHRVRIPEAYRSILLVMNGAHVFGLALFGISPSMAQRPPLLDRSTSWPYDIGSQQQVGQITYAVGSTDFLIGGGPRSHDENIGYSLWPNGHVESLRYGGAQVKSWSGIGGFLAEELARAEALSPEHEEWMAKVSRPTSWWSRLRSRLS
jgi:hypothetical protein